MIIASLHFIKTSSYLACLRFCSTVRPAWQSKYNMQMLWILQIFHWLLQSGNIERIKLGQSVYVRSRLRDTWRLATGTETWFSPEDLVSLTEYQQPRALGKEHYIYIMRETPMLSNISLSVCLTVWPAALCCQVKSNEVSWDQLVRRSACWKIRTALSQKPLPWEQVKTSVRASGTDDYKKKEKSVLGRRESSMWFNLY